MSLFQVTKKQVIENYELRTMTGDIVSFTPSYSQLLPDPFSDLNVTVNVVATGGNGTPDNPIPINGYSSANITRCGVNLWDEEWEVGGINYNTGETVAYLDRIRSKNYVPIVGGTSYYACSPLDASTDYVNIAYYDASKTFISGTSTRSKTWTAPANACYLKFNFPTSYGTSYNNDISINYPSSETLYHAYNGDTVTIAFGQTVYGGVLDVTRGKLHVEKAYKDLGSLNYTMYSVAQGNLFRSDEFDVKRVTSTTEVPDILSSIFVAVASANRTNYTISMTNNTARIDVIDDDYSDAVAFKSAMSGVQIVYPLETPFDIDLTPEVISAIVGTNNVFADCGETTVTCLI